MDHLPHTRCVFPEYFDSHHQICDSNITKYIRFTKNESILNITNASLWHIISKQWLQIHMYGSTISTANNIYRAIVYITLRKYGIMMNWKYLDGYLVTRLYFVDMYVTMKHRLLYKWTMHGKSPSITTDPNTEEN